MEPNTQEEKMHIIREARYSRNWNQTELATQAGLSVPVISRMETGRSVNIKSVTAVCEVLELDLKEVLKQVVVSSPLEASKKRLERMRKRG